MKTLHFNRPHIISVKFENKPTRINEFSRENDSLLILNTLINLAVWGTDHRIILYYRAGQALWAPGD
jgi:hypothetical protein